MRYIILTKKHIVSFFAFLVVVSIVSVISFVSAANVKRELPIYSVKTDEKKIAFSFDAAWGNEDTEQLIGILNKYNIKATFFLVGYWVDKYPESVKALYNAGHEIGNHSNSHPDMSKLSQDKILEELNACNSKIEKTIGVKPTLFRAPFGAYNNNLITTVKSIGMNTIQWDCDSKDWMEGHTAERIKNDVLNKVKTGSIVLSHNAALNTPAALPAIIEKLQADGYTFCKISDLIYKDNYTINHKGEQILNKKATVKP